MASLLLLLDAGTSLLRLRLLRVTGGASLDEEVGGVDRAVGRANEAHRAAVLLRCALRQASRLGAGTRRILAAE